MTTHHIYSSKHELAAADDLALNASTMVKQMLQAPQPSSLKFHFYSDNPTTRLICREHFGTLGVQQPRYPEEIACCQSVILHLPGDVVDGDELRIQVSVNERALLSTPGAPTWCRSKPLLRNPVEAGSLSTDSLKVLP